MATRIETTDRRVLAELGDRLAQHRLNRNLTQDQLAREAGVSKRTIVRLENGQSSQVTNLLRVLRALGLLGDLDALVPARWLARSRLSRPRPERRRASPASKKPKPSSEWTWGDDKPTRVNREHCRRGSAVGTADRRGFIDGPGMVAAFEYSSAFARSGIEVAPLMMPLSRRIFTFPDLPRVSFHGLPGMLADTLPDKFGNAVIDAWLAAQGRLPQDIDAVERLCYTGTRGMGALEFKPALGPQSRMFMLVKIDAPVDLAAEVLRSRENLQASFADPGREHALREILRVGASAGGARAKAVIAWNPKTNEVLSGQVKAPPGFEYWLLKFDGVSNNTDRDLADPQGFGAIEYAYSLMGRAAGIRMADCRLFEESGRRHFMTRRFDRFDGGEKLHMQSLAALCTSTSTTLSPTPTSRR